MNPESLGTAIEIVAGFIFVPWVTWVTVAIFTLRQQHAVLKSEMQLMKEIRNWLRNQNGVMT